MVIEQFRKPDWKVSKDLHTAIKSIFLTFQRVYLLPSTLLMKMHLIQILFSVVFQVFAKTHLIVGWKSSCLSLSLSPSLCDVPWWSDICSPGSLHFLLSSPFKLTHWKKQHFRKVTHAYTHIHKAMLEETADLKGVALDWCRQLSV